MCYSVGLHEVGDGVGSARPECGRHHYLLLLQDEAILNGEFLVELPVVGVL